MSPKQKVRCWCYLDRLAVRMKGSHAMAYFIKSSSSQKKNIGKSPKLRAGCYLDRLAVRMRAPMGQLGFFKIFWIFFRILCIFQVADAIWTDWLWGWGLPWASFLPELTLAPCLRPHSDKSFLRPEKNTLSGSPTTTSILSWGTCLVIAQRNTFQSIYIILCFISQ